MPKADKPDMPGAPNGAPGAGLPDMPLPGTVMERKRHLASSKRLIEEKRLVERFKKLANIIK